MAKVKSRPKSRSKRKSSAGLSRFADNAFRRVYEVVLRIPRGKVMTYGEVAAAAGMRRGARIVGYAMRALGTTVPWQRVLGRKRAGLGHVTIKDPTGGAMQRLLLEKEGVCFSAAGTVDLDRFGWQAKSRASAKRYRRSPSR